MDDWKCLNKTEIDFLKIILDKNYKTIKILKDDKRSLVEIIEINEDKFVLKVPREKNTRKWQRVVNVLRKSDSIRSYKTMIKMENLGIKSTKAIFAAEKRTPFVVNSFLIMEVLEGIIIEKKSISLMNMNFFSLLKKP